MHDFVSIVMLSDKNGQYLIETIRSVQAQTYKNWELLYVDDSQKVDCLNIVLKEQEADSRIKVSAFVFKNGSARARTTALREANGRWIAFIDAGDLWKPTKLEKQITFMREHDLQNTVSSTEMARMKELLYLLQIISIRH